jgi:penicillin-binding protein 2
LHSNEIGQFDTITLCSIIDVPKEVFTDELKKAKGKSTYRPSVIIKQIPPDRYALLKEKMYKYPGLYLQTRNVRTYPFRCAAHVLGYIGEVSPAFLKKNPYYRSGDYIGVSGIEKAYEEHLRGRKGVSLFLVDVHGRLKALRRRQVGYSGCEREDLVFFSRP